MLMVTLPFTSPGFASIAYSAVVGVPLIVPVQGSNVRSVGSAGVTLKLIRSLCVVFGNETSMFANRTGFTVTGDVRLSDLQLRAFKE